MIQNFLKLAQGCPANKWHGFKSRQSVSIAHGESSLKSVFFFFLISLYQDNLYLDIIL